MFFIISKLYFKYQNLKVKFSFHNMLIVFKGKIIILLVNEN